ncbi:HAMP domain-containing protein [bacterium]|nr:HAMP domain-containing protein [bacterium]
MRIVHNIPIKYKLIVIILSVTLLIIGLAFWIGGYHYQRSLKTDLIQNLEMNARLTGEYCVTPLVFDDPPGAERVLSKLQAVPLISYGAVYNDRDSVFAAYQIATEDIHPPFPIDKARIMFHDGYLHVLQPVEYKNVFYGHVYLAGSMDSYDTKIAEAYRFMIILLLILIVLSILLAFFLQRVISQPILKLAQVTEHISNEADLSLRVKKKGSDELGVLYDGFNTMMEQLHLREIERDRAAEEIKSSLREKEVMLKEIHHRVKNNLQIISSLLNLQSNHIHDENALAMFVDCQNRVRSMAIVHEQLYHSPDLASINFSEYVEALINGLQSSYRADSRRIQFDVDILDIPLDIDRAVPCGLIIHELVSNAIKHAFNSHHEGLIQIKLRRDDHLEQFCLSVRDNGQGIPESIDYKNTDSLGLRLAVILTEKQLKGSIDLDRSSGTAFHICF